MRSALSILIVFTICAATSYIINGPPKMGYELLWHISSLAVGIAGLVPVALYCIFKYLLGFFNID